MIVYTLGQSLIDIHAWSELWLYTRYVRVMIVYTLGLIVWCTRLIRSMGYNSNPYTTDATYSGLSVFSLSLGYLILKSKISGTHIFSNLIFLSLEVVDRK